MTQRALVLVVDDDEDFRAVLERRLPALLDQVGLEGADILTATGITVAKNVLRQRNFELIISDHQMLDGTGYDILSFLLAQCDTTTKFVMVTDGPERAREDLRFRILREERLLTKPTGTSQEDFAPWIAPFRAVLARK